ncbi:hypothetical protein JCM10213v2_000939 [Rhodosporidiobolus nylandii]
MDWHELLRKFRKHNPSRELTAQTASLLVLLATSLSTASRLHSSQPSVSSLLAAPPSFALPSLPPLIGRKDEPAALTAIESLESFLSTAHGVSPAEVNAAKIAVAYGRYAVGQFEAALRVLKECELNVTNGQGEEGYGTVLKVVGCAVEAFSLSHLLRPASDLLPSYQRAAGVYDDACEVLSSGGADGKDDIELHRWGGEVLFRACLIARESSAAHALPLPLHLLYLRRSTTFLSLSGSRSVLAYPATQRLVAHRSIRTLPFYPSLSASESAANDRAQERLVRMYTAVPKAGEVNRGYLRFLDEVVEGFRRRGAVRAEAGGVVEILYGGLTHTLQSHSLLRHLIHVLTLAGRPAEAVKALRLYRSYGDKARETGAAKTLAEMRRLKEKAERGELTGDESSEEKGGEGEKENEKKETEKQEEEEKDDSPPTAAENLALDIDSDQLFVQTVVFGVRLLVKELGEPREALELAKRARAVWEESREEGKEQREALVEWALGTAEGAVAAKKSDPSQRAFLLESTHTHLRRAVSLTPTSLHYTYTFAYSLLAARHVSQATSYAKKAVELAPSSLAGASKETKTQTALAWHLLALCVSAGKDMRGALDVLEAGLDLLDGEDATVASGGEANGFAATADSAPHPPASAAAEQSEGDQHLRYHLPSSSSDLLAALTQLRLTKQAVIEYLEGSSAALVESQQGMQFFSGAAATAADDLPSATSPSPAATLVQPSRPSTPAQSGLGADGKQPKPHRATSILGRRRSSRKQRHSLDASAASSTVGTGDNLRVPASPSVAGSASPARSQPSGEGAAGSVANLSLLSTPALSSISPSRTPVPSGAPSAVEVNPHAALLLCDLWLASAASFRRAGRQEEARGACGEAESAIAGLREQMLAGQTGKQVVGEKRAAVWSQLALIHLSLSDLPAAKAAVSKALSFSPTHLPSLILLSRLHLTQPPTSSSAISLAGAAPPPPPSHLTSSIPPSASPSEAWKSLQLPLAEATLTTLTQRAEGCDAPEAWFELSRCFQLTGRKEKERECLVKALALEETRPARSLRDAVPAVL